MADKIQEMKDYAAEMRKAIQEGQGSYENVLSNTVSTWANDQRLFDLCREAAELYLIEHEIEDLDRLAEMLAERMAYTLSDSLELDPEDLLGD